MRAIWAVSVAACSGGGPAVVPAPVPSPEPGLAIVLRNDTDRPVDPYHHHNSEDVVAIIDEAGALAPIALHLPPYGCDAPCESPPPTCTGFASTAIEPHASRRMAWDGTLRRPLKRADGTPCYERVHAPAGTYLMSACSSDGCVIERFELPRHDPIVLALRPRDHKASCDRATVRRALRVAYGAAAREGVQLDHCPDDTRCMGPELHGQPGACAVQLTTYNDVFIVNIRPAVRDGVPRAVQVWVDGDGVDSGNFWLGDGTWGVTGSVSIGGQTQHRIHTHGGDAAPIYSAAWTVYNQGDQPVTVELRDAAWITNGTRNPLARAALDGGPAIVVAPHSDRELTVSFAKQDAYQSWNDHFAVDATFVVDGAPVHAVTDIAVSRVEPIR